MTRKDYILIAAALRDAVLVNCPTQAHLDGATAARANAALILCDKLARDNPRFDRERFLKAAGVQS